MTRAQVARFLKTPSAGLIDYAISMANLTEREHRAIDLCGRKAITRERAAEMLEVSAEAVQKWYAAGMDKLVLAWTGVWWLEVLSGEG